MYTSFHLLKEIETILIASLTPLHSRFDLFPQKAKGSPKKKSPKKKPKTAKKKKGVPKPKSVQKKREGTTKVAKRFKSMLLKNERELVEEQLLKLRRSQNLDYSSEVLDGLLEEYERYMFLCKAFPKLKFSPSKIIDDVWHSHIICTARYRKFCQRHFGAFVDHDPSVYPVVRYARTLAKYREIFQKEPPIEAWPDIFPPKPSARMEDGEDEVAPGKQDGEKDDDYHEYDEETETEGDFFTMDDITGEFGQSMAKLGYDPMSFLGQPRMYEQDCGGCG